MQVHIEGHPDTHWMAHVLEEPGCIWIALDRDKLLSDGPAALHKFKSWLEKYGEPRININPNEKLETARVHIIPKFGTSGAAVALFDPDYNPTSKEEICTVVRRLGYARKELLELVTSLPADSMDWQPLEGKRTLRKNLDHIRNCQSWYLSRLLGMEYLQSRMSGSSPQGTMESLHWMQENVVRILLEWPPTLYGGVYKADRPEENWTPRKMVRRILEHELEHISVICHTISQ